MFGIGCFRRLAFIADQAHVGNYTFVPPQSAEAMARSLCEFTFSGIRPVKRHLANYKRPGVPGVFLLFSALVLLVLTSISVPFLDGLDTTRTHFNDAAHLPNAPDGGVMSSVRVRVPRSLSGLKLSGGYVA